MNMFITSSKGGRFRSINLDNVSFVDFVSLDENHETAERCTIYFISGDKSVILENPHDVQKLMNIYKQLSLTS